MRRPLVGESTRSGKSSSASVADLSADPSLCDSLLAVIREAVDRSNEAVSRAERIKRFRVLDVRFEVGEELTPLRKMRRDYICARYAAEVEAPYRLPRYESP